MNMANWDFKYQVNFGLDWEKQRVTEKQIQIMLPGHWYRIFSVYKASLLSRFFNLLDTLSIPVVH